MNYFPDRNSSRTLHFFEKSANYYDSTIGYLRASRLLPDAKIIVLAGDPALRAYSWYQVSNKFFFHYISYFISLFSYNNIFFHYYIMPWFLSCDFSSPQPFFLLRFFLFLFLSFISLSFCQWFFSIFFFAVDFSHHTFCLSIDVSVLRFKDV